MKMAPPTPSEKVNRKAKGSGSYSKVAKVGALWSFARESMTQLIAIPTAIILARLLTPEEFGITAAATFFTMMANRLTTLGLNAALIRIKVLRSEHTSSVFVLNLAMGVAVWLALTAAAPAIGAFYRSPETGAILPVAALTFLVIPFGAVPVALLHRDMKFREVAIVNWIAAVTFSILAPVLAWHGFSFWSLVYAQLAANIAQSAAKLYLSGWTPSLAVSGRAIREIFPFGAGVYAKRLIEYGTQNLDSMVVGRVLGMTALGFYDKAFNTMDRFVTRFAVGPGVSFRVFSLIGDDPERFKRGYHKVMLSIAMIALPVFTGLFVIAEPFIVVVFGETWRPSIPVFRILCVVGALKLLNTYAGSATQALGLIWAEVWRQVVYGCLIVVGILVGSRWGIAGAAAGVLVAALAMTCLMQTLMSRVTGLGFVGLIKPWVPGLSCSAGLFLVLRLTEISIRSSQLNPPDWALLLVHSSMGGAFCLLYLLFSRSTDVRALIDETLNDLAPRLARILRRPLPAPAKLAVAGRETSGERLQ
jgi:O-antigen/teichoic acid export membrane protein